MFQKVIISAILVIGFNPVFAQLDTTQQVKKTNHYLGIQANGLLREIFNFGNPSAELNNPYLLTYTLNSRKTGWGMNFGFGYSMNSFEDSDETFERTTDRSNLTTRIGVERKQYIKKLLFSYGFDLLLGKFKNSTDSKIENEFNIDNNQTRILTDETSTEATVKTFGFGPRVTFNYQFSPNIIVGTEATYYFKKNTTDQNLESVRQRPEFNPNTGVFDQINTITEESESSGKSKEMELKLPLVLYLIFKF